MRIEKMEKNNYHFTSVFFLNFNGLIFMNYR